MASASGSSHSAFQREGEKHGGLTPNRSPGSFTISALDGDDLIAVDSLFTQLGTADGGRGTDTYLGNTRWTRISV